MKSDKKEIIEFWNNMLNENNKKNVNEYLNKYYGREFYELAGDYYNYEFEYEKELKFFLYNKEYMDLGIKINSSKVVWGKFSEYFIRRYWKNITQIEKHKEIIVNIEHIRNTLITSFINRVFDVIYRAMILETKYCKKEGKLEGDTPEERANFFNEYILGDVNYIEYFLKGYPEIYNLVDKFIVNCIDSINVMLDNTKKEKKNIENELFGGKNIGKINYIYMEKGDTHNHGKTVSIIEFEYGDKVVYKPRQLELEESYNKFIGWLESELDNDKKLYLPNVYYNESVGWMEYVDTMPCESIIEVEDYYYKVGRLICILYTFNSNDMHSGNIIARGNSPVLIDLETLFHPNRNNCNEKNKIDQLIKDIMINSVKRSALLPSYIVNMKNNEKIDIGGISNIEEQISPFESNAIEGLYSDEVRIVKKRGTFSKDKNITIFNDKPVDVKEYLSFVLKGFVECYIWIDKNKECYISKVKQYFSNKTVRVLLRGTNEYARMLQLSYHSDLLVNHLDRVIYLVRTIVGNNINKSSYDVLHSEIQQLLEGDIPYFCSKTDNKKLYAYNEIIDENYYDESAMMSVENKVNRFSISDMHRQIMFMYDTFNMEYPKKNEVLYSDKSIESDYNNCITYIEKLINDKAIYEKESNTVLWFTKDEDIYNNMILEFENGVAGVLLVLKHINRDNKYVDILTNMLYEYLKVDEYELFTTKIKILYTIKDYYSKEQIIKVLRKITENYEKDIKKIIKSRLYSELIDSLGILITLDNKFDNIYISELVTKMKDILIKEKNNIINKVSSEKVYIMFYHLLRVAKGEEFYSLSDNYNEYKNNHCIELLEDGSNLCTYLECKYARLLISKVLGEENYESVSLDSFVIEKLYIGKDYTMASGDAKIIMVLHLINRIIDDENIKKFEKNYRNIYISEFVSEELKDGGYYDINERFGFNNGMCGVAYSLLFSDDYIENDNIIIFN